MMEIDSGMTNPDGDPEVDPDDKRVRSTSLSASCNIEVLQLALRDAKNPRKALKARRRALRIILKNKSINRDFLRKDSVASKLRDIALESLNDEDHNLQHFDLKRYAFQCLKSKANDLSDDFYRLYSLGLRTQMLRESNSQDSSGLMKLSEHIGACGRSEKFRILESLSVALSESNCGLRISMFNDFLPSVWTKESLLYALLSKNNSWDVKEIPRFVEKINALDDTIRQSGTSHSIEDVLMILIETQNHCRLNIAFINNILTSVGCDIECLDVITRDFCFLPMALDELAIVRVKKMCDRHKVVHTGGKDLTELRSLLLYSDKAIASVFDKINPGTRITDLVKFFRLLKSSDLSITSKEDFLLDLAPSDKSIDDWNKKLCHQLIENIRRPEFPNYKNHSYDFDAGPSEERNIDAKKHTMYLEYSPKQNRRKWPNSDERKGSIGKLSINLQDKISRILLKCGCSEKIKCLLGTFIKSPAANNLVLDSEDKIVPFTNALEILIEYGIDITDQGVYDIFSKSNALNVQGSVHKFAIERSFPGTYEKSFDQLIEELGELNGNGEIGATNIKELSMSKSDAVRRAYSGRSKLLPNSCAISEWQKKDVEEWVNKFSNHQDPLGERSKKRPRLGESEEPRSKVSQAERIAVITKTVELICGFQVRDVQLLSVILLLNPSKTKGRLSQINTGEGKTMIISMIAAYHAMKGRKVDVITSSPLLAEPQAKQQERFYSALGLTVSHNINNHNEGYKADVVYGTSQAFQGDILQDEFRKHNTRRGRRFDIAIVDEVDNMLVDGNNYIVMLSCEMPAMDHLAGLLATIFIQVKHAGKSIQYDNGKAYFVEKGSSYDEKGEARQDVVEDSWYPLEVSPKEFITDCTDKHIRKLIRDTPVEDESFAEIKIPKHLRELVCKAQLKKWIERAIDAPNYVKDVDYILDNGEIKIVDAANTGVVKKNSQWSSGLHQFLQIKHGTKISPETLSTNFISNVSFFKRYRSKLYGLTGTLGTNGTKELLSKTYGVDSVVVPPFKLKQYKELAPIVVDNKDEWYTAVVESCLRKLNNGRPVLIIMENIKETRELEKVFKDDFRYDVSKIKMYKTEDDAAVVEEEMKAGHVIITTNIAGRGTDIKPSKDTDANGGLHVCITFLPRNSRVEIQNIGRTSRTGNRGTSQFVLWSTDENDITKLKTDRAIEEKKAMDSAEEEIVRVTTKDMIFKRFCGLCETIKGRNSFSKEVEKKAVEERFAIWLEINEDKIEKEPREKVLKDFESFVSEIQQDDKNSALIKNPYMHVMIGNKYLKRKNYKEAIKEYTSAIELDSNFAEHARYNRGYAYVAEYGGNVSDNATYIDRAADDFKEARRLIDERQNDLTLIQIASDGKVLSQQVRNKCNLYHVQKNAIDVAIGPDVEALDRWIERLENQRETDGITPETESKIAEDIRNLRKDKEIVGFMQKARENGNSIQIELRELMETLPDEDWKSHEEEIREFERNGYIGEFIISEISPINWLDVIGLGFLGVAQLVVGAALAVFTLGTGTTIGMDLIAEGNKDIIRAVKDGIINRNFNWATWAVEKTINITASVINAGFKAIKDCAQTACSGIKAATSAVTRGITETAKNGWKIVAELIGLELAKEIGKEIAKDLMNYRIDKTLIPDIEEEIVGRIRVPIQEALQNNPMIKKMLELDEKGNKDHYKNRIIAMGCKILNPENNQAFMDIAREVASRVANNKFEGLAVGRKIAEGVEDLFKLNDFVANFIKELNEAIDEEARKNKVDEKSVGRKNKANLKEKEQVEMEVEAASKAKVISNVLVKAVSANRVNKIKEKIIAPVVERDVNYSIDNITSSFSESIEHETQLHKSQNRLIYNQNKGYKDPKQKKKHLSRPGHEAVTEAQLAKASDEIERLRAGGPSGLAHLGPVSDAADCPIDVCNEQGKFMYTIGDEKKGTPVKVEYHEPKNGETIGHYTLPGGEEPKISGCGRNMCLYNVVAEQKGLDPTDLKDRSLKIMDEDPETFAKQSSDITYLEMYARMKLALGGAACNAENPNEMEAYLTNSDGKEGFQAKKTGKPTKGHPLHHVPYRRKLRDLLEATSEELQTNIAVYNAKGDLHDVVGDYMMEDDKELFEFKYYAPEGDNSGECLMSIDGKEVCPLNNPYNFWRFLGKQTGQKPDDLENSITKRMDAKTIPPHESYKRTMRIYFQATSEVLKRNVELYDEKGKRFHTVRQNKKEVGEESLKFKYRKPQGDKLGEYVSLSTDGEGQHRFVGPPLEDCPPEQMDGYWMTLSQMTKQGPDSLKRSITKIMDAKMRKVSCIEEASRQTKPNKPKKTGFISMNEANYVSYYVKEHPDFKAALDKLNEYEEGVNDSDEYIYQKLTFKAKDLNMPRTAWGGEWKEGYIYDVWPITGEIEIKLQHYKGEQTNRDAPVHIQTIFPRNEQNKKQPIVTIIPRLSIDLERSR